MDDQGQLLSAVVQEEQEVYSSSGRGHLELKGQHELKHEGEKTQGAFGEWQGVRLFEG